MAHQYSQIAWIDVLYTSVLNTPGKVEDAARFLTERRGVRITGEALRLKLREVDGARLSGEMFELLVEWMLEKNQPHAMDAVHAFNGQFGLVAVSADRGEVPSCINALVESVLSVNTKAGGLADEVRRAVSDGVIERREAESIEKIGRAAQRRIEETIQIARRAGQSRARRQRD
ncbi:phage regulatory CII family protein [Burkholderia vietnamiensis]|uniref:phage regulatory CII family protein n=1 Tax=Burkholderia vietnamiensis TaxID=60552 RepID=UPI001594CA84|nr:phage regulatory CII family protein [Burkholderia vietnamiensis]MDN7816726.1 hypothetical protein [Burkholderia vietnamiensis]HDR9100700.1 hypothetical protein [Burkholderia vietnamiensis]